MRRNVMMKKYVELEIEVIELSGMINTDIIQESQPTTVEQPIGG